MHRVYQAVSQGNRFQGKRETIGNPEVDTLKHRVEVLETDLRADEEAKRIPGGSGSVEDLRSDRDAWREQVQRKRLTWRGLFGGGKAE